MLFIHHSNRSERLLDRLAEVIATPVAGPLVAERIVVPTQGMARWIAFGIAQRHGVAANLEFQLPAGFAWRLFHAQLPSVPEASGLDRATLPWRLFTLLPNLLERPGFDAIARYLQGVRPERRRFQLSRQLADLFDQYLVYRPDMILAWERGDEAGDWQAELWRAVVAAAGPTARHWAHLVEEFIALARAGRLELGRLPRRVALFGVPTLSPAYLALLAQLAEQTELHLFIHNPCREYWGDVADPRQIARRRRRTGVAGDYLTSGNRLLASWGRQGRDLIDALLEIPAEEAELFEAPEAPTLLAQLQRDILDLTEHSHPTIATTDDSLEFHRCHGPMREVEVLHDRLWALFDADPSLAPHEVVVMTPDIESYTPYLEAVFGAAPEGRRLPFAIADLAGRSAHPLIQAFLDLLALGESRFTAPQVLALLEIPAVRQRYRLDENALTALREWVREAGVRWGTSAAARADLGLPATDRHTWSFGLRRLFLGYALPPQEQLFAGVLPLGRVEGQQAADLGSLAAFLRGLERLRSRLSRPRSAAEWAELLHDLLEEFFLPSDAEEEPFALIREAIASLVDEAERAELTARFGLDVLRDDLSARLTQPSPSHNLITGRITCCAMVPMRTLPFRVICLIGLAEAALPRRRSRAGFDRMAAAPRRLDRSHRDEERYLFLEALLAARDRLYLSWVGRNQRDDSPLLPSVLVSELLDYLREGLGAEACDRLITTHPLQPFSPAAFTGPTASYAAEWLPGAQAQRSATILEPPFCPQPLPAPTLATEEVALADLIQLFRHPSRWFLRERLGMQLVAGSEELPEDEPFTLNRWEAAQLPEEALERLLTGGDLGHYRTIVAARGDLPEGAFGELILAEGLQGVEALVQRLTAVAVKEPPVEVDLTLPAGRLQGWISGLGRSGIVRHRVAEAGPRDLLALYIEHLALCAVRPDAAMVSRFYSRHHTWRLAPIAAAQERLAELLELFRHGQNRPLPLFPRSSWAYAQPAGERSRTPPLQRARKVWEGSEYAIGEREDPWLRIAWRGVEQPLDGAFVELTTQVLGPLFAALTEEPLD